MHDPLTVFGASGDDTDVVRPNHNDTHAGPAGRRALSGPFSCKPQTPVVLAEIVGHVLSAPSAAVTVMMVMMSLGSSRSAGDSQRNEGNPQHNYEAPREARPIPRRRKNRVGVYTALAPLEDLCSYKGP
jgi:hypothetical protein